MKGIMFVEKGRAAFIEEDIPACSAETALLQTLCSGMTHGTKRNVLMDGSCGVRAGAT
ncbi:MAG: hypothetical protein HOH43_21870, partial [Candidatus Latescibacteria bacterium]|nr:hypothetical protein [Candidatus Latescibacterota bacterium]